MIRDSVSVQLLVNDVREKCMRSASAGSLAWYVVFIRRGVHLSSLHSSRKCPSVGRILLAKRPAG
jgi:hypothetical protein